MNKIIRVLLAMVMLFSVVAGFSVAAAGNTITVTEATITSAGVVTVAGTTNSTGKVTLLLSKQAANADSESLLSMANGQVAYIDQATPDANGNFKFVFKPLQSVTGDVTTVFVCAEGVAKENLLVNNIAANTFTVNYEGNNVAYTSQAGAVKVDLRSAEVESVKVATEDGYFKSWEIKGVKYDVEGNLKGIELPYVSGMITAKPEYYTVENKVISSAQAQRAVINDEGVQKNVIRFLALVDASYADYAEAGFVFSTLGQNPTIEAGYKPYGFNEIFNKIKYAENVFDVTEATFTSKFTKDASMVPTGIVYANIVIPAGNEGITYYATPYVQKTDGTRVYGKSKAISYNELVNLDEVK